MVEKERQEEKSLCEKSMQLMVNVIKLSAFSLATMNFGGKHETDEQPVRLAPVKSFPSFPSNSWMSRSKRSQTSLSKSKIMDPGSITRIDDGDFSDYIKSFHRWTKNEENTDGKAATYIRKFHEKNSRDYTLASSTPLPLVLPPPPSSFKK